MKMSRTNTISRSSTLLFIALTVLSLATYGTKGEDKMDEMSSEPKNAEEVAAMYKELVVQGDVTLLENTVPWEKVFVAADKGMTTQEDGKNYGDFPFNTIGSAKDQFTADELKLIQGEVKKIRGIEDKLTMIEKRYPTMAQESLNSSMSMPADNDMTTPPGDGSTQKFPASGGKDPDGNAVKSNELSSSSAVTIVNFWFIVCNSCVGEFAELDALNKELTGKGGEITNINAFTLGDNEVAISETKDVLSRKGATYRNMYFPSGGEAGRFTTNVFAYSTTYVVDRNGNIVGDPIVGVITGKAQVEALQTQTDRALSADMG